MEALIPLFTVLDILVALPVAAWVIARMADAPGIVADRALRFAQSALVLPVYILIALIADGQSAVLPSERAALAPLLVAAASALCLLAAGMRAAWRRDAACPRHGRGLPPLRMSRYEALVIAAGTTWLGTCAASAGLDLAQPAAVLAGSAAGAMVALYACSASVRACVTTGVIWIVLAVAYLPLEGTSYASSVAAIGALLAFAIADASRAPVRLTRRRRSTA